MFGNTFRSMQTLAIKIKFPKLAKINSKKRTFPKRWSNKSAYPIKKITSRITLMWMLVLMPCIADQYLVAN